MVAPPHPLSNTSMIISTITDYFSEKKEKKMLLEKNKILMSLFSFVLYLLVCLKTHPSYQGGGSGDAMSRNVKSYSNILGLFVVKPTIKRNCRNK